jgi:hypothetical protein
MNAHELFSVAVHGGLLRAAGLCKCETARRAVALMLMRDARFGDSMWRYWLALTE